MLVLHDGRQFQIDRSDFTACLCGVPVSPTVGHCPACGLDYRQLYDEPCTACGQLVGFAREQFFTTAPGGDILCAGCAESHQP